MRTQLYTEEQALHFNRYWMDADKFHDLVMQWSDDHNSIPCIKAITIECDKVIALDNTTHDCWVEEFDNVLVALDWIEGRCDSEGVYIDQPSFEDDTRSMYDLPREQRRNILDIVLMHLENMNPYDPISDYEDTIMEILCGSASLTLEDLYGVGNDEHPHLEWVIEPEQLEEYEIEFTYTATVKAKDPDEAIRIACEEELHMDEYDIKDNFYIYVDGYEY